MIIELLSKIVPCYQRKTHADRYFFSSLILIKISENTYSKRMQEYNLKDFELRRIA